MMYPEVVAKLSERNPFDFDKALKLPARTLVQRGKQLGKAPTPPYARLLEGFSKMSPQQKRHALEQAQRAYWKQIF